VESLKVTNYEKIEDNICPNCGFKLEVAGALEFDRRCNSCGNFYNHQDTGDYYETIPKKRNLKKAIEKIKSVKQYDTELTNFAIQKLNEKFGDWHFYEDVKYISYEIISTNELQINYSINDTTWIYNFKIKMEE